MSQTLLVTLCTESVDKSLQSWFPFHLTNIVLHSLNLPIPDSLGLRCLCATRSLGPERHPTCQHHVLARVWTEWLRRRRQSLPARAWPQGPCWGRPDRDWGKGNQPILYHTTSIWTARHFCRRHFHMHFFSNESYDIWIKIPLKSVSKDAIDNLISLVVVMAWHRTGAKPLPQSMITNIYDTTWSNNIMFHMPMVYYDLFYRRDSLCCPLSHISTFNINSVEINISREDELPLDVFDVSRQADI